MVFNNDAVWSARGDVIHYHGTPIWGDSGEVLKVAIKSGGAFVSYARPDQIKQCLEHAAKVAIDNGAFSAWKRGLYIDWTDFYKWLMKFYFYEKVSFIVIPDIIDGSELDNDELVARVPSMFKGKAAPVWHLHESIERLIRLCDSHEKICFGSSGEYAVTRTKLWHARMIEAFSEIYIKRGFRTKVHGLRMLDGRILGEYPLHTADSTNLACNVPKWKVKYPDLGSNLQHRAAILRNAVESVTPPTIEEWICSRS